ncbi:MAG: hypothetical protein WC061_01560, partial [Melioribacteraceae bacterium]
MNSLPFLPKKYLYYSLLVFLSLISSCGIVSPQVRIKEKVGINPASKISNDFRTAAVYSPLEFRFGGPRPFTFIIEGPGGSINGSNDGWGSPASVINVPAVNGNYNVAVTSNCECQTNVGYSVTWLDPQGNTQWIAGYQMWFWFGGTKVDTFSFNRIPAQPPPFDFSIKLSYSKICGSQDSGIKFECNREISSLSDKTVQLSLEEGELDLLFYDYYENIPLGKTMTTTLDKSGHFSVRLNSPNAGESQEVKVNAFSNGLLRSDTLTVEPSTYIYSIYPDYYALNLLHGQTIPDPFYTYAEDRCTARQLPDSTRYNLNIVKGIQWGHLIDPATGNPVNSISFLSHQSFGEASFEYIADGLNPAETDTAVVRISATDPRILPVDIEIHIRKDTSSHVTAYFEKENLSPGETVNIIIKNVDSDGNVRDYPPETLFEAAVIKGCNTGLINGAGTHLTGIMQPV